MEFLLPVGGVIVGLVGLLAIEAVKQAAQEPVESLVARPGKAAFIGAIAGFVVGVFVVFQLIVAGIQVPELVSGFGVLLLMTLCAWIGALVGKAIGKKPTD